jgi:MFS family permease
VVRAGVPVAVGALGAALASWPPSRLMGRFGRRPGLAIGYGIAVVGSLLGIAGVFTGDFVLFLVGMTLFGISNTSNLLARYAAADIMPAAQRGRAMGLIVWGSTVGSIVGPNLMKPAVSAGALLGLSPVASGFLISVTSYALAAILVEVLLRPDPLTIARRLEAPAAGAPPAPALRCDRAGRAGAPGVRHAHGGPARHDRHHLDLPGLPARSRASRRDDRPGGGHAPGRHVRRLAAVGWLSDRFGRGVMIAMRGLVLLLAMAIAGLAPGRDSALVMVGFALNGVGWNFAFVAGSALLTDALSPNERASIQGLADLVMGLLGALGSAAGGIILGAWGFGALNALGAAVVVGGLAAGIRHLPLAQRASWREVRAWQKSRA